MAARIWRIRDRATFADLRRHGRRARNGPVTVTWLPGEPATTPRVAYALNRRFGPAVARNRMRRRLRAVVAELAPELAPGAYLIGAAPAASDLDHAELRLAVGRAAAAAGAGRS